MKKKNGFLQYVEQDLLGRIPGITSRAMFGGYGIYKNGVIFAIIADDRLYFRVTESNIDDYKHSGSEPIVYQRGNHKKTTMPYWLLPEEIMEDPEKIPAWVEKAVQASKESKKQ